MACCVGRKGATNTQYALIFLQIEDTGLRYKVQTHFWQMASRVTSRRRRKACAASALRIVSNDCWWMLPSGRWKKHGRTVPSASTTVETQGALQIVVGKSPSPLSAAK